MQTGNITGIVETVYLELRAHKVKKNAIEAKLREIGEKSKEKKVWVLKSASLQAVSSQMYVEVVQADTP